MLLLGHGASTALEAPGGLDLVVAMVAGLSERDPFVFPDGRAEAATGGGKGGGEGEGSSSEEEGDGGEDDEEVKLLRQKANALKMARFRQWRHPTSDALARLRAVGAFAYAAAAAKAAGGMKCAFRSLRERGKGKKGWMGAGWRRGVDPKAKNSPADAHTRTLHFTPLHQHIQAPLRSVRRSFAATTCCTTPPWPAPSTSAGSSPASSTGAICVHVRFAGRIALFTRATVASGLYS